MTFISYAQNFEDVMLYRALKHVQRGVYVDVGAQHPTIDSVTKAFSIMGWRGVNIEPVQHWFNMLEEDRPHDLNLNVAVGEVGSLIFFEVKGTGLSTTDADLAARYVSEGRDVIERTVRAVPLDEILASQKFDEVHFLKVDCEGAERVALATCSFDTVRPWIVVVEATAPNSQVSTAWQWEGLLADRGYLRVYDDGLNLYFVAMEHKELLSAFKLPPNVFDDYVRARDKEAHEQRVEFHLLAHNLNLEVRDLRSSIIDLSRSLGAANDEHLRWRARANEDLVAAIARSDALEVERAVAESRRLDERVAFVAREVELEASVFGLSTRLEELKRHVALEEQARLLQRQHEMHRQIAHLQLEISRRDGLIHAMMYSTSWRITAPVRLIKLRTARGARAMWRMSRPAVARVAKISRPLVRIALRAPPLRSMARFFVGSHTRIGRRARAFLFPGGALDGSHAVPLAMTESAEAMKGLLLAAIERKMRE